MRGETVAFGNGIRIGGGFWFDPKLAPQGLARNGGFAGSTVPSNILFENFTDVQDKPRPWARCEVRVDLTPGFLEKVSGRVRVVGPKETKSIDLGAKDD